MSEYDDYVSGRVDARYEAFLKRTADPDLVESRSTRRELVAKVIVLRDRCLEAEAALAERDREVTHWGSVVRVQAAVLARVRKTWYPLPIDRWYRQEEEADLRARAEKGRES